MTPAFGGQYSIQLSYGRVGAVFYSYSVAMDQLPVARNQVVTIGIRFGTISALHQLAL